jgi:hypothetical protein
MLWALKAIAVRKKRRKKRNGGGKRNSRESSRVYKKKIKTVTSKVVVVAEFNLLVIINKYLRKNKFKKCEWKRQRQSLRQNNIIN